MAGCSTSELLGGTGVKPGQGGWQSRALHASTVRTGQRRRAHLRIMTVHRASGRPLCASSMSNANCGAEQWWGAGS